MEIPPYPPSDDDDIECNRCGGYLIERDHARSNCPGPWTIPELLTALEEARGEVERLHGVLQRVSDKALCK